VHTGVARSTHRSQNGKNTACSDTAFGQTSFCLAGARVSAPEGFVAVSKMMAGVGHLKKICKDEFRVARDIFIKDVRRSGR